MDGMVVSMETAVRSTCRDLSVKRHLLNSNQENKKNVSFLVNILLRSSLRCRD